MKTPADKHLVNQRQVSELKVDRKSAKIVSEKLSLALWTSAVLRKGTNVLGMECWKSNQR